MKRDSTLEHSFNGLPFFFQEKIKEIDRKDGWKSHNHSRENQITIYKDAVFVADVFKNTKELKYFSSRTWNDQQKTLANSLVSPRQSFNSVILSAFLYLKNQEKMAQIKEFINKCLSR